MNDFGLLILLVGGVWGLFSLIGDMSQYKTCAECKYQGDVDYMAIGPDGKRRHLGCVKSSK